MVPIRVPVGARRTTWQGDGMATSIKRFDVEGRQDEVDLARATLERCTYDFGLLAGRVRIEFTPAQRMEKVPGTDSPALAFCRAGPRLLKIRSGLRRRTARSVLLHEIGHMVDADTLRRARRVELMSLMNPLGEGWGGNPYRARPCECFAETFVRAFSDVPAVLTDYYQRRVGEAKLRAFRKIVLRNGASEPDDEPVVLDPEEDPDTLSEEEPAVRQPINIVTGQIGAIERGTPFFHPDTGVRITSAEPGGDFELVGQTEDGQFRFAVVETAQLIAGQTVRALFLVEASRVTNVRVQPGGQPPEPGDKLAVAKAKAREIVEL